MGGISSFIKNFPTATSGQYEGFAYLGIGNLILIIMLITIACLFWKWEKAYYKTFFERNASALLIFLTFVSFVFLATGGNVTFNDTQLFHIDMPSILSTFRATGRFVWPAEYILIIVAVYFLIKYMKPAICAIVLILLCALQISEMRPTLKYKHDLFSNKIAYASPIPANIEKAIANSGNYKHINFTSDIVTLDRGVYKIAIFAFKNNLTLNDFHLARKGSIIEREKVKANASFFNNAPDNDTIYIISHDILPQINENINYYHLSSDILMASRNALPGIKKSEPYPIDISFNHIPITNGQRIQNNIVLNASGSLTIPYRRVPAGRYILTISGSHLDSASLKAFSYETNMALDTSVIKTSDTNATYAINLDDATTSVQLTISNNSQKDIVISNINIRLRENTDATK